MKSLIVAPSVLSMNYGDTFKSLMLLNESNAKWLHFDVMDGHFVPNISFGPDVLKGISEVSNLFLDVHLMIDDPRKYCQKFIDAGANLITVHIECFEDNKDFIEFSCQLRSKGVKVGITWKPAYDMKLLLECLDYVDLVLVMSVEPGFGGQSFQSEAIDKISFLVDYRDSHQLNYLIEVDGGISDKTVAFVKNAGVDVVVAGSYVFKGDILKNIDSLL